MKKIIIGGFLALLGGIWHSTIVIIINNSYGGFIEGGIMTSIIQSGWMFTYVCSWIFLTVGIFLMIKGYKDS